MRSFKKCKQQWMILQVVYTKLQKTLKNLIINLKGLEYISSAGLRVILGAQKKMQKVGSMKVTNVCEAVMEVFEITGFADILTIE